jgi:hypothetical protein
MKAHRVADLFPAMSDIQAHGQREPIWTWQGFIIDGRHRERACNELGRACAAREWDGEEKDLVPFVVSLNLKRRHLGTSQRAMIASAIAKLLNGQRKTEAAENSVAQSEAAELLNVSVDSVQQARKVQESAIPELTEAVASGAVSVSVAAVISELPEEEQLAIFSRGESEIIAAAKKVKSKKRERRQKQRVAEKAAAAKTSPPLAGEKFRLICSDISEALVDDNSLDAIITDPPYPIEHAECYDKLRDFAQRTLKAGGHLVVMTGQANLYDFAQRLLSGSLKYQWTFAYLTPGQSTQVFGKGIKSNWKPVLWFVKGKKEWEHVQDIVSSDANDKRFHEWGQSVGGMAQLIDRFTVPGSIICDPFCGGGTTGIAAVITNRFFIGIDNDQACVNTAAGRLKEPQRAA